MPLPLRFLGRDGPQVPAVGLGFGSLAGFYGPPGNLDKRVALLDHAHATGLYFWDMADVYIDSEDVVGEWLKRSGRRNDIFLSTKFSLQRQSDGSHTFRSDPEYVKAACEKSLQRLGVDTIDLYYCHRVDGVTPIAKTIEAMVELKNQGKIRYLGLLTNIDARAKDSMGRTPLASAAECGHKALVEILIQCEEVVADSKDVSRALSAALKRRNQGIVQLLTALVSGN